MTVRDETARAHRTRNCIVNARPVAPLNKALGVSLLRITRMQPWIFLAVAILSEVMAASALKASEGCSRVWPSLLVSVGYTAAFYVLSLTLNPDYS